MRVTPSPPRRPVLERIAGALLVGIVLFLGSYVMDVVLYRLGIPGAKTIIDNIIIGLLGALSAYFWVRFEAEKQARVREKLILIIELNHHIRNALTLISHSVTVKDDRDKLSLIDSAIERIDRVLTELVPTVGTVSSPRLFLEEKP